MKANEVRHESKVSQDHKRLKLILTWIRLQGREGIKRGNLIIKSEIPVMQWQFYHMVLVDLDEVLWDKSTHTYTSMDSSTYPKESDNGQE